MARGLFIIVLTFAAAGCVSGDRSGAAARLVAQSAPATVHRPPRPDKSLVRIGGKLFLPRWKTEQERASESAALRSRLLASPLADTFDSYRLVNISKFLITAPPVTAGFRAVAEFEPSQAYLMAWMQYQPAAIDTFFLTIVSGAWGKVPVLMAYDGAAHKTFLEGQLTGNGIPAADLADPSKVIWWQASTDAVWSRDFGPFSIVTTDAAQKLSFVDFRYYHDRIHDDEIPADLAAAWGIDDFRPDLSFEGGNFMSTTNGLCVASKVVLDVNPQFSQSAIEDLFKQYLGCKKMVFLTPIIGDGTGHVDMFAKLGSDTAALVGQYTPDQDAASPGGGKNVTILNQDAALLAATPTPAGKTIAVTRIPMPDWGQDVWGSYVRTYTNAQALRGPSSRTVLIPVYSDETSHEADALAAFSSVFPGWTQVKIDAKEIISWGGAVHCVLMQIAVGAKSKMEPDPAAQCGNQLTCTTPPPADLGPDRPPPADGSGEGAAAGDLDGPRADRLAGHDGRRDTEAAVPPPGGCSCAVGGRSGAPSLAALLLGVFLAVHRRRR